MNAWFAVGGFGIGAALIMAAIMGRTGVVMPDWFSWKRVGMLIGAVITLLIVWGLPLQAPSPKTVWEFTKMYWLWILLVGGALYLLTHLVPKEKDGFAGKLRGTVVLIGFMLFAIVPLVHLFWGEKSPSQQAQQIVPQECTSASPCTLTLGTDGSSERVHIPQGKSVCFEPYFWNSVQRLGYKTSYKGGMEGGTGVPADTFRFVPESEATVPRYWFVQEGTTQC